MSAVLTIDRDGNYFLLSVIAGSPAPQPAPPPPGSIRVKTVTKRSPSPILALREIARSLEARKVGSTQTLIEEIGIDLTGPVRSWIEEIRRGNPGSTLRVDISPKKGVLVEV